MAIASGTNERAKELLMKTVFHTSSYVHEDPKPIFVRPTNHNHEALSNVSTPDYLNVNVQVVPRLVQVQHLKHDERRKKENEDSINADGKIKGECQQGYKSGF